jgi:hypothetical protein
MFNQCPCFTHSIEPSTMINRQLSTTSLPYCTSLNTNHVSVDISNHRSCSPSNSTLEHNSMSYNVHSSTVNDSHESTYPMCINSNTMMVMSTTTPSFFPSEFDHSMESSRWNSTHIPIYRYHGMFK